MGRGVFFFFPTSPDLITPPLLGVASQIFGIVVACFVQIHMGGGGSFDHPKLAQLILPFLEVALAWGGGAALGLGVRELFSSPGHIQPRQITPPNHNRSPLLLFSPCRPEVHLSIIPLFRNGRFAEYAFYLRRTILKPWRAEHGSRTNCPRPWLIQGSPGSQNQTANNIMYGKEFSLNKRFIGL